MVISMVINNGSKKVVPKYFLIHLIWSPKNWGIKKKLGSEKFSIQKLWDKVLGPEKFWYQKVFILKKFWPKIDIWSKTFGLGATKDTFQTP